MEMLPLVIASSHANKHVFSECEKMINFLLLYAAYYSLKGQKVFQTSVFIFKIVEFVV